jgi:hypothetical protein
MFASLAPQVTENPIYMHCTVSFFNGSAAAPEGLRRCIDQASDVGFEMVILSFGMEAGSDFNLESTNQTYIESMRAISEYAATKGVEMGGYDLLYILYDLLYILYHTTPPLLHRTTPPLLHHPSLHHTTPHYTPFTTPHYTPFTTPHYTPFTPSLHHPSLHHTPPHYTPFTTHTRYDLLAHTRQRGHNASVECIGPDGQPDGSTCLASQGSDDVISNILAFVEEAQWSAVETDGPFEGETCAATNHSHHQSLGDSVYWNWKRNMEFYHSLIAKGVYINAPDPYYFEGTHKDGMGYDEMQWSRPKWEWITQARQQIYDQTFLKIASSGYMFCPLEEYHGGGAAAIIEPIAANLQEYEWVLATYFGTGVQAAYRGYRLYDPASAASKALVTKWVSFFKAHRVILNSDIIHISRPDLKSVDAMLHVNADPNRTDERGLCMIWNQTPQRRAMALSVPLYYTGLSTTATVTQGMGTGHAGRTGHAAEGTENSASSSAGVDIVGEATMTITSPPKQYTLARDYSITVDIDMPPMSVGWLLIK